MINCCEFENAIQRALDRRDPLESDAEIVHHAQACAECAGVLRHYRQLENSLDLLTRGSWPLAPDVEPTGSVWISPVAPPAPELEPRNSKSRPAMRDQQSFGWVLAIAACLLAMAFGQWRLSGNALPYPASPRAIVASAAGLPTAPEGTLAEEAGIDFELPLPTWSYSETSISTLRPLYELTGHLPGVRPLEHSIYWALDLIQRSIPIRPAHPDDRSPQPDSGWRAGPSSALWV